MKNTKIIIAAVSLSLLSTSAFADSKKVVWGGGKQGASTYTDKYVPKVIDGMSKVRLSGYEWGGPSEGTTFNLKKVSDNPTHVAVVQNDLAMAYSGKEGYNYTVLKENLGPECLYAITKESGYDNFGHILGNSWDLKVITGGQNSGSYGTWKDVLVPRYAELSDMLVEHAGGTMNIVESTANSKDPSIGFFVMRPDPNSKVFEKIKDLGLKYVPVVDMDLENIYKFYNLKVSHSGFAGLGKGNFVQTSCTSVALVTGNAENASDSRDKRRVKETIKRIKSADDDSFTPKIGSWRDMFSSMTQLVGDKLTESLEAAKETARELAEKHNK